MKIIYFESQNGDAVDYYRVELPISTMGRFGVCVPIKMGVEDVARYVRFDVKERLSYISSADIFVVNRMADRKFVETLKGLNPKAKIVADYDDNSFAVSPFSPHYETNGTKEVRYMFKDGNSIDLWASHERADAYKDQKTKPGFINIEKNKAMLEDIKAVASMADLVTVTTDVLRDVFTPYAKKTEVLPNCIDKRVWSPLNILKTTELRIGWFGGYSHYEDWAMIAPAVREIMRRNEHVKLVIMGFMFKGTLEGIPKNRIEFHPWVGREAYPYKAATLNLDFGIIPLHDTEFSRCKSPIKFIEMAALKIPAVVSLVSPYKELSTTDNGVWVDGEDDALWVEGIQYMIDNPRERRLIAESAHQSVMADYEIHGQFHRWAQAYKGVLNGVSNSADLVGNRS